MRCSLKPAWIASVALAALAVGADSAQAIFPPPNGGFRAMDYNRDGSIDLLDLDILGSNFGKSPATFEEGDSNADGTVDLLDLDVLGAGFGQLVCDLNGDGAFDILDVDIFGSNFGGEPSELEAWIEHCGSPVILSSTSGGVGAGLSVPEPASALLLASVTVCCWTRNRRD